MHFQVIMPEESTTNIFRDKETLKMMPLLFLDITVLNGKLNIAFLDPPNKRVRLRLSI